MAEVTFWHLLKTVVSLRFIHNNNHNHNHFIIIINFFKRVFSECTKAITTSLIPLEILLPEYCAFIIGFSCIVQTKMRLLDGSIADGVPFKFCPTHQYKEGMGSAKSTENK